MNGIQQFRAWYAAQPRALRTLVAINVVAYLVWQVFLIHIPVVREFVWNHLALNPGIPGILYEPWQLLTYGFLHLQPGLGGLLHMGFNMLWIWWIGRDLEDLQGPHTLTAVYIFGAVGGALLTVLLHGAFPGAPFFGGIVHGASGGVLGVLTALAVMYPYKSIGLFIIGVVKLRHVVIGLLAMDILFLSAGGTSVSAHFGGAAAGLAFAKFQAMGTDMASWAKVFFSGSGRSRTGSGQGPIARAESWLAGRGKKKRPAGGDGAGSGVPARGVTKARIIRMDGSVRESESVDVPGTAGGSQNAPDIDQILDKISARGYDSLTPAEKKTLYEASGK
jgi:rhomboid family protein